MVEKYSQLSALLSVDFNDSMVLCHSLFIKRFYGVLFSNVSFVYLVVM